MQVAGDSVLYLFCLESLPKGDNNFKYFIVRFLLFFAFCVCHIDCYYHIYCDNTTCNDCCCNRYIWAKYGHVKHC